MPNINDTQNMNMYVHLYAVHISTAINVYSILCKRFFIFKDKTRFSQKLQLHPFRYISVSSPSNLDKPMKNKALLINFDKKKPEHDQFYCSRFALLFLVMKIPRR